MRTMTWHLLVATLLLKSVGAVACPICLGLGLPSTAQQLVEVRQQYPSRLAILAYLRQSPGAEARGFAERAALVDGVAERLEPSSPQR